MPGLADHREDPQAPVEVQYGPAHAVTLVADGWLAQWHGSDRAQVNSVHGQGIAASRRACRSRPWPTMGWSKPHAACTIVSCSAYSGTRVACHAGAVLSRYFPCVRPALPAAPTEPTGFPMSSQARRAATPPHRRKHAAALAEGAAHHRGGMPGAGHHRQRAADHSRRQVLAATTARACLRASSPPPSPASSLTITTS